MDGRNVGVWNFVDASEGGCKATHTGVEEATAVDHDGCYTFDGTGYATQRNIRNYDPRYLSVSMEFRSYDEDALLVLLVSDNQVRVMLICIVISNDPLFLTTCIPLGNKVRCNANMTSFCPCVNTWHYHVVAFSETTAGPVPPRRDDPPADQLRPQRVDGLPDEGDVQQRRVGQGGGGASRAQRRRDRRAQGQLQRRQGGTYGHHRPAEGGRVPGKHDHPMAYRSYSLK